MSTVRFLSDENFRSAIVQGLRRRQPNIDIVTLQDAGFIGQNDPSILAHAAQMDRVLISHDVNTMPIHFTNHLANGGV
jgi:predicted nuclease of predicted toxin-antitoxin system